MSPRGSGCRGACAKRLFNFSSAFENKRRYNVFMLFESVKICVNLWLIFTILPAEHRFSQAYCRYSSGPLSVKSGSDCLGDFALFRYCSPKTSPITAKVAASRKITPTQQYSILVSRPGRFFFSAGCVHFGSAHARRGSQTKHPAANSE